MDPACTRRAHGCHFVSRETETNLRWKVIGHLTNVVQHRLVDSLCLCRRLLGSVDHFAHGLFLPARKQLDQPSRDNPRCEYHSSSLSKCERRAHIAICLPSPRYRFFRSTVEYEFTKRHCVKRPSQWRHGHCSNGSFCSGCFAKQSIHFVHQPKWYFEWNRDFGLLALHRTAGILSVIESSVFNHVFSIMFLDRDALPL
jgi:hypothetical protein